MAFSLGNIVANLVLNDTQFQQAIGKSTATTKGLGKTFRQTMGVDVAKSARKATKEIKYFSSTSRQAIKDVSRVITGILISQAFYRLIRAIQSATAELINFSKEAETAQIAFEYLLGSAEKAAQFFKVLQIFAAKTPFEFPELRSASQNLLAMGFNAKDTMIILRVLSDTITAVGKGSEELLHVAQAIGRIRAEGKLTARQLKVFSNANINVVDTLRNQLGLVGKTTVELAKEINDMGLSINQVIGAIIKGLSEKYPGASQKFAKTMTGLLSTLKDNIQLLLNGYDGLFQGTFGRVKDFVGKLVQLTDYLYQEFRKFGKAGVFEAIFPPEARETVKQILMGMRELVYAFRLLYNAIKPVITALAQGFAVVMSYLIPIIAKVIKYLALFIHILTQSTVFMRYATAASIGLVGGIIALKVAGTIAGIIMVLAKAILALYVVISSHPIGVLITAMAVGLGVMAVNSQKVAGVLSTLGAKIRKTFDIDTSGFLTKPEEQKQITEGLSDISSELGNIGEETDQAGKDAGKSKGKFDKFLAAFDEVYAIPEALEDIGKAVGDEGLGSDIAAGLGDISDIFDEDFTFPEVEMPDFGGIGAVDFDNLLEGWEDFRNGLIDIWNFIKEKGITLWTNLWETIKTKFQEFISNLPEYIAKLKTWLIDGWNWLLENIPIIWDKMLKWIVDKFIEFAQYLPTLIPTLVNKIINGFLFLLQELPKVFKTIWDTVKVTISNGIDLIAQFLPIALQTLVNIFKTIWSRLPEIIVSIGNFMVESWKLVWTILKDVVLLALEAVVKIVANLWIWLDPKLQEFKDYLWKAWDTIVTFLPKMFTEASNSLLTSATDLDKDFREKFRTMREKLIEVWRTLWSKVKELWNDLVNFFIEKWEEFKEFVGTTFDGIKQIFSTKWEEIKETIKTKWNAVVLFFTTAWHTFKISVGTLWEEVKTIFGEKWDAIKDFMGKKWDYFTREFIPEKWAKIKEIFKNILMGKDSIKTVFEDAWEAIKNVWVGAIKGMATAINELIKMVNKLQITTPEWIKYVGLGSVAGKTWGVNIPEIDTTKFADGGISLGNQIVEISEKNKKEAVLPLESPRAMEMIANAITERMPAQQLNQQDNRPTVFVHTLIADERGLKELYRKLNIIELQEKGRRGES